MDQLDQTYMKHCILFSGGSVDGCSPKVFLFLNVHVVDAVYADIAAEAIRCPVESPPMGQVGDGVV